ncbi:SprT-like domain-containing protein [Psychroflexus halocasei]|uniref:SprT-like family protein n=1 Tax=Psychroflexus halocasei TaxID=908615 RepID=A0A1H3VD61_9FLAO|nr:SprT-like domain-containing protein [Psychroflexus halocasei]SDZ72747.1 SprT-like family protein [Psychroflexus halocasei]
MQQTLLKYIPSSAVTSVSELIKTYNVHLKIVKDRQTKHGDYRMLPSGKHQITVNYSLNPYRFLMTLIHEIAHLIAFETYGHRIKPHGVEWKYVFQKLMLPLINPKVFPDSLLPVLAKHFRNPSASSDTDPYLSIALKKYDSHNEKNYIFEIPIGSLFTAANGRVFKKGKKLRKRYECLEISTKKIYVFQPNAEIELIKTKN